MLWITLFMSALTISLGQLQGKKLIATCMKSCKIECLCSLVESCISYNASGHPMLNIMWNDVCLYYI